MGSADLSWALRRFMPAAHDHWEFLNEGVMRRLAVELLPSSLRSPKKKSLGRTTVRALVVGCGNVAKILDQKRRLEDKFDGQVVVMTCVDVVGMDDPDKQYLAGLGINFVQAAASHMGVFDDGSFDLVVATNVFQNERDFQATAEELKRVSSAGFIVFAYHSTFSRALAPAFANSFKAETISEFVVSDEGTCVVIDLGRDKDLAPFPLLESVRGAAAAGHSEIEKSFAGVYMLLFFQLVFNSSVCVSKSLRGFYGGSTSDEKGQVKAKRLWDEGADPP
jgi:hypothetical protein